MKKILVFDDDQDILDILTYLLTEKGWDVRSQPNCNDVINTLSEYNPDLIIMDNWIPDSGGVIATRTIKAHDEFKHIPVIYFSANNDLERLAAEAGADTWLPKPFDLEDLEKLLSKY